MALKTLKPKVVVQIRKNDITLEGLIRVLKKKDMILKSIENDVIYLIMDEIAKMQDQVGALPSDAKDQYNEMLNDEGVDYTRLPDSDKNIYHYTADEENELNLWGGIEESSNAISLPKATVFRTMRVVENPENGEYYLTIDPHTVDYTAVHLKGFKKYVKKDRKGGMRLYRSVEGRDILYTALSRAMPGIRSLIAQTFVDEAKNE